jgi:endoglucanase
MTNASAAKKRVFVISSLLAGLFLLSAGGVVPGILLIKPDFPENKDDWPSLWGENEYVIDICAHQILLVNAVMDLCSESNR